MNTKRFIALALAVMMALSVFAGGAVMAASTTVDSDLDDTETTEEEITENIIADFNADEEQSTLIQVETTTTTDTQEDFEELSVNISYDGVEHYEMDLSDIDDADFDGGTDSTDAAIVDFHVDHDELRTLPGSPGESTFVNVTIDEVEDADDGVEEATEFLAEFQFGDDRAVIYAADGTDAYDALDIEEPEDPGFFSLSTIPFVGDDGDDEMDTYALDTDVAIAGDQTDVTVIVADDAADAFADAAENYDETGDPVLGQTVAADGSLVPVYHSEAADWQDGNATHAVYDDGEMTMYLGDEYGGEETVDLEYASANALDEIVSLDLTVEDITTAFDEEELTVGDLREEFTRTEIGIFSWLGSLMSISFIAGTVLSGLFVAHYRLEEEA